MVTKKIFLSILLIVLISPFILAQNKITISTFDKDVFQAGEPIKLKVSLYDESNNLVNDKVLVTLEDYELRKKIEKEAYSNQLTEIELGEGAISGYWKITADYNGVRTTQLITVEANELVEFSLSNDILTVTNIGNTEYNKKIRIFIGEIKGIKEPHLEIGEETTYRLIAPDGSYNIKITDGITTFEKANVQLTGKIIGALGEGDPEERTSLTGGVKPENEEDDFSFEYLKRSKMVYIFLFSVLGAMILLTIERIYQKYKD
jgi:ABC-type Na+ efflux pump permease subunit